MIRTRLSRGFSDCDEGIDLDVAPPLGSLPMRLGCGQLINPSGISRPEAGLGIE